MGGCYVYYSKLNDLLCKENVKDLAKAVAEQCKNALLKIKDALCEKDSTIGKKDFVYINLEIETVKNAFFGEGVVATTHACCKKTFDDIHVIAEKIMSTATMTPDKSQIGRIIPHEMTHVFQHSYPPLGTETIVGLLTEGIADYGGFTSVGKKDQLFCIKGEKGMIGSRSNRWTNNLPFDHQCLGAFLKWLQEKYPKASVCELHKFLKNNYKSLIVPDQGYDTPLIIVECITN